MKKTFLFLLGLMMVISLKATIKIADGQKYYFVCTQWPSGSIVLGENHSQSPLVYYDMETGQLSPDSYWILKKSDNGDGYTICNAQSKQYLVYSATQQTNANGEIIAKGIVLSSSATSDYAVWKITENGEGAVYIENAGASGQYFNIRNPNSDTPYLVGTYRTNTDANGLFNIYDENGKSVMDATDDTDPSGTCGTTENGEYWELTGLQQPVVYTTDTANPVLYTIRNIRSGLYVIGSNSRLTQSDTEASQFYFVDNGNGVQIYTSDNQYVETSYPSTYKNAPLNLSNGTAKNNIWKFGFYSTENTGYTICKADNLPGADGYNQSSYLYWNDYNLSTSHVIGLYNLDAGCTFVFYSSDRRHLNHLLANGVPLDNVPADGFKAYVYSIQLNDKDLTYDRIADRYYAPLPANTRGEADYTTTVQVKFRPTGDDYTIRIDDNDVNEDGTITIPAVSCDKSYKISVIKNGTEEVAAASLNFTFLPIVELEMSGCNGSYYTTGRLRVTDATANGYAPTLIAAYRYRGASAQGYSKKSYNIKLRDEQGNSVDHEFFGLRNDNNWILDAMAVDMSCMRNRVSTDLWNDFATPPYQRREGWEPKAKSGTRGRFVEVFLNGTYHGLYCMTEKVDRKQLRLKKSDPATDTTEETIHGTLYKGDQWNYEVLMGHELGVKSFPKRAPAAYDNNSHSETWRNFEIKYPDYEEEKIDWGPLWNAINFVATSSDSDFGNSLPTYFDYDVLKDYYLFLELLLATDNHGKNTFFFNYDQQGTERREMIGIAPWDLDGTWGRRWDGSNTYTKARQDFDQFIWSYEHGQNTIFYRLQQGKILPWNDQLKERYAELRETFFAPEALQKRFQDYAGLFSESGADIREQDKWAGSNVKHSNIQGDVTYICSWIKSRIDYLDNKYDYTPVIDGIDQIAIGGTISISGGKGCIYGKATTPTKANIYTLGGALIKSVHLTPTPVTITGFTPGIYLVNGQKVIVK